MTDGPKGWDEPAGKAKIPAYLFDMVRREPPVKHVVPRSTPVVSFGNALAAEVATLGINPSASEFVEDGVLLQGTERRLATLDSISAKNTSSLTDEQVRAVLADCWSYFSRNPYRPWFDPLDSLMRQGIGTGTSYHNGSACHLDLVQWATTPVWGRIKDSVAKRTLLDESRPHLVNQLNCGKIKVVLLNGDQVVRQVKDNELATFEDVPEMLRVGSVSCRLFKGARDAVKFFGWSTNLQSRFGVPAESKEDFKEALAKWIRSVL